LVFGAESEVFVYYNELLHIISIAIILFAGVVITYLTKVVAKIHEEIIIVQFWKSTEEDGA